MAFLTRWTVRVLATLGLLYVLVTALPGIDYAIIRVLSGAWNDPKGDILIVLGGDAVEDMVGPSSYWRSIYAARVWREQKFRQMVISGGSTTSGPAVAVLMKSFVACLGVPEPSVRIETASTSTRENAINTARLLEHVPGRKVLLTSDYHAYRAYHSFRKAGLDVIPSPFPDALKSIGVWRRRWPAFLELCIEIGKIGYYKAKGWI